MQIHRQFNRLFIGKILLSGSNFLILLLLSNFFPEALAGEYFFQVTIVATIAIFLGLGTDNSLFYFISKNILSVSNLLALAWRLLWIVAAIAGLILCLFYFDLIPHPAYLIFSGAYIFSLLVQNIFNAIFSARMQGWKLQAVNLTINLLFCVYLLADIFFNDSGNMKLLLFVFYGVNFLTTIIVLLLIYGSADFPCIRLPAAKTIRQLFKFGSLPYISNSIFFLGANIDLFFIKYFCNPKLTVYIQAVKIFQVFCSVTYLLYYPFMGKILRASKEEGVESLLSTGRIVIVGLLLLLLPFYLLCYFFLDKIFPHATPEMFKMLLILSVAIIATSTAYLYTSYFVATKKYRQNIISAVIFLVTVVILCVLLIPAIGVYGGVIAYSVAIVFSLIFDMVYIVKSVNVRFSDAFFLKKGDLKIIKSII